MTTFGLDVPAAPTAAETSARAFYPMIARAAEDAGFARLWVGDHALWHQPRFEALSLLSALSGWSDLALGSGVLIAPLRHPVWTAKCAATLDRLTDGQFTLGLGIGGEYTDEFEIFAVDRKRRGALTDAAILTCRRAWSGELHPAFSPLPPRGDIPIWVGGRSDAALRRAGRLGDGYLGLFLRPEDLRRSLDRVDEERRVAGRSGVSSRAMALWMACDEDGQRARDVAGDTIAREYQMPPERFAKYVVAGTPAELVTRLEQYLAVGLDHVHIHIAHPDTPGQIELFGSKVLAAFQ